MLEIILLIILIILLISYMNTREKLNLIEQEHRSLRQRYEELQVEYKTLLERLSEEVQNRAQKLFEEWKGKELNSLREQMRIQLEREYRLKLEEWLKAKEREIREDAIKRSVTTILGRIGEYIAPLIIAQQFNINPKDIRYLGTPVDYIAFKGLSDGKPEEIIFTEVKTGKYNRLTNSERAVRDLVNAGKVRYYLINLRDIISGAFKLVEEEARREAERQVNANTPKVPAGGYSSTSAKQALQELIEKLERGS